MLSRLTPLVAALVFGLSAAQIHAGAAGFPEINVSGNTIDIADGDTSPDNSDGTHFGSTLAKSGSNVHTFSISNPGQDNLNIGSIAISGPHAADFAISTPPPSPIVAIGSATTFQVTFAPNAIGNRIATLTITSNDPDNGTFDFVIQGVGSRQDSTNQLVTQTTPVAIPSGPGVVTSTIVVSGAGSYLYDLKLRTFIPHTFAADLDITITSPSGKTVTLSTDNGAGNDNVFNGTVWDDSANPGGQVPYTTNNGLATDHAYVNNETASPLVPEEALGAFIGEDPNGTWTLTISDDLAGDGGSIDSWSLDLTTLPSAPDTESSTFTNTTPLGIPDGPAVVTSTITVSGAGTRLLDVNLTTALQHTFAADLDITIQSPSGTVVTLTTDNGAGNDNTFDGTVWDDSANPAGQVPYTTNNGLATDHAYVNLTAATSLAPEEALAAFIGEDPNGTWTITISDDLAGDGGSLNSWSLNLLTELNEPDPPVAQVPTRQPVLNKRTGLYEWLVTVTNPNAGPITGFDLFILDLPASVTVRNAATDHVPDLIASAAAAKLPALPVYRLHCGARLAGGASTTVVVELTSKKRPLPTLTPTFELVIVPSDVPSVGSFGVPVRRVTKIPGKGNLVEFASTIGGRYRIWYTANLFGDTALPKYNAPVSGWYSVPSIITGTGTKTLWMDQGPPSTLLSPLNDPSRQYRVELVLPYRTLRK